MQRATKGQGHGMSTEGAASPSTERLTAAALKVQGQHAGRLLDGRFCLLACLGEGGMGSVWLAEQLAPVKRQVAVKLIRLGQHSPSALARFEAERQALALMDHPGIAAVHDGGIADGDPYYVMELVQGEPLTASCASQRLTLPQRLRLFIAVCQAVQHAHQKGIIHRDLKPANILVTEQGGQLQPKLIDFGIAKFNVKLTEETVRTQAGDLVGTLEYMAPEQAAGDPDIDTRADVYALGVILYELLTGRVPFSRKDEPNPLELLRLIREAEPMRPSQRVATGASARQLHELDWIVMKCLEKQRSRRYATVAALAEDVERYLRAEPVLAGPPSAAYRARKFLQRHWKAAGAAAALVLVLLAGVIGTTLALFRAWDAEEKLGKALNEARQAAAEARTAEQVAVKAEKGSRQVVDFFTKQVMYAAQPVGYQSGLGRDVPLRIVLDAAVQRISEVLAGQPEIEVQLRLAMGTSYTSLGELALAKAQLEAALALATTQLGAAHELTLAATERLAAFWIEARQPEKGAALMRTALDQRRQTRPEHSHVILVNKTGLAQALLDQGKLDEAGKLIREALADCDANPEMNAEVKFNLRCLLAAHAEWTGQHEESLEQLRQLLAEAQTGLNPNPLYFRELVQLLAVRLHNQQRYAEAEPLYRESERLMIRDVGDKHPTRVVAGFNLAALLMDKGEWDQAREQMRRIMPLVNDVFPADHVYRGAALVSASWLSLHDGKLDDALAQARESAEILKKGVGTLHPFHANALALQGAALTQQQKYAEAEPLLVEAAQLMLSIKNAPVQRRRWTLEQLINLYETWGKPAEAEKWRGR